MNLLEIRSEVVFVAYYVVAAIGKCVSEGVHSETGDYHDHDWLN